MDHDHNFKNLILDYPREALAFLAESEARRLSADVRITPIREEQLKEHLSGRFRELDIPLLVEWPDGSRAAIVFVIEEESNPKRFSILRLAHYCLDIAELIGTRRVVPVVVFLRGGPNERRLDLGGDHATYLSFHYLCVEVDTIPYRRYRDSDNLVARLNLPIMRYDPNERVDVYAAAVRGLNTLEPDPKRQLKYVDFIDIYTALDDNERQRYETEHPQEAQIMSTYLQRVREESEQIGEQRGEQRGEQQGEQRGEQRGLQKGEVLILLRQMGLKFGKIPDEVCRRVEQADSDTLLMWSERILTANSIDDLMR